MLVQSRARATHAMGGEITWECQGANEYIFELIFYRDCNGFEVNTVSEIIRVWNHPTVTDITVDFIQRIDISPICTPSGGVGALLCGTGSQAGNGAGAVEKIIYRSVPINLGGSPTASGWFFTYDNFSRNGDLTNLSNPTSVGITISAGMFPIPGATGGCIDHSPKFLQDPYLASCAGIDYNYNPHAVDRDLDSLVFSFAAPLDYFPTGNFNPPVNPAPIAFEPGFSFTSPTPDASMSAGNIASQINPQNGSIIFRSFNQGNFAMKIRVDSYRQGVLIAYVEREIQIVVLGCDANNSSPIITPPFAGGTSFETTVFAGDLVNFNLNSIDIETLQDGSPQSNLLTASGLLFGSNFTNAAGGCDALPCATLSSTPTITGVQSVNSTFNWQTSCDHLVDATGNAQNSVPYIFVFKVQDDYCPVPKVTYATVTINVENQGVLNAPSIDCITTAANDDITINWTPIIDPNGDFVSYQLHTVNGGVEATIPGIGTNTFTLPGAGNSVEDYFLSVQSGCGGLTARYSDTLKNIFLTLNNSGNGEAQLIWNNPTNPALNYFGEYYHIYKEYPAGTWNLIDSVPYGITNYRDTIDVCQAFISYEVTLTTAICDFTSNIEGDIFEDAIVPDQPIIYSVDIDTLTGAVTIIWNENNQQDTYGYVIYSEDANGFLVEIDTVWGISSTSYTYFPNTSNGALTHSIAAFDSCFTDVIPPTYQTSAKGEVHTTAFLSGELDVCTRRINLSWSSYAGFDASPEALIWGRLNNGTWQLFGTSSTNEFSLDINLGENYVFAVQYIDLQDLNRFSFSNIVPISFVTAGGPTYSYISVATVSGSEVTIRHRFSQDGGVNRIRLEKYDNTLSSFIEIDEQLADAPEITFIDTEVEVDRRPYTYRTLSLDTCNQIVNISNIGQTIYLTVNTNETEMIHLLQWTPYEDFPGGVREYKIYRGFDGVFDPTPIGITTPQIRSWVDTVYNFMENYSGKVCYLVEAIEGPNIYGFPEVSQSNVVCPVIPPLVFIPNAFTLGGKNPVFAPVTNLHRIDEYQFEIYDRYGRIIFETNEPNIGWDGRIEKTNRYAREGVYIYRISLRDGNGIEFLKHGHVTLLDYREVND